MNVEELKNRSIEASNKDWYGRGSLGPANNDIDNDYIAEASPQTILAMLDVIEKLKSFVAMDEAYNWTELMEALKKLEKL